MEQIIFWDSVSNNYGNNNMTTHQNDFELNTLFNLIKENEFNIYQLSCIGVADGCRDPIMILEYLKKTNKNLPQFLYTSDLSSLMINHCAKKLLNYKIKNISYNYGELKNVHIPQKQIDNIIYYIGCYDSNYIQESLEMYKGNKQILGEEFTLTPLYYNKEKQIDECTNIVFNIETYEYYIDLIKSFLGTNNFLGYRIKTNTGFISHYYNKNLFETYLKNIFIDSDVALNINLYSNNGRYIIASISKIYNNSKNIHLVTTLNNVIGNIPTNDQFTSLYRIYESFFK